MPEKFQPRIVASFNQHQLNEAASWWGENAIIESDNKGLEALFSRTFDSVSLDEKGKLLDDKGRNRLKMAMRILTLIHSGRITKDFVGEIKLWQNTPDPDHFDIRWGRRMPRI